MNRLKEFLERLEESMPEGVSVTKLKTEFNEEYEKLVKICQRGESWDFLIEGDDSTKHIRERGLNKLNQIRNYEIQKRQTDIQEQQTQISNNQTKILNSTFWIYSLTAFVMLIQLVTDFMYNKGNLSIINGVIAALFIALFLIVYSIIWEKIALPLKAELSKYQKGMLILILILLVISFLLAASPSFIPNWSKEPTTKIEGKIGFEDLDKISSMNQKVLNSSLEEFKQEILKNITQYLTTNNYNISVSNQSFKSNHNLS